MRRVHFLTGTRADFGKLKPLMLEVERARQFDCGVFVTGMHLLDRYGSTYIEIEKCGFKNIYKYMNQMIHTSQDMDLVLASTIQGLSHYVSENRPDLLVVHGDRVEALAGAIVGALNNILVAHVEGGELSGTVDELIRHSISKMAHVHFVANQESARRLVQMGETPESVFIIGSPDIDVMFSDELPMLEDVKDHYDIGFDAYGILIYHPVTTEIDHLEEKVRNVVQAVQQCGWNFIVTHPNNDAGSDVVMRGIDKFRGNPRFRILPSVRFEYFLVLLRNARAIVGNSSAGIREATAYSVPTINIGSRQSKRFAWPSIVNVPEDKAAILKALNALPERDAPAAHFGDGKSTERFMRCLKSRSFWEIPCQKQFRDLDPSGNPES